MITLRGGIVTAVAAGALLAVPVSNPHLTRVIGPRGLADPGAIYGPAAKEFYLTADEIGYIRPGFHITVNSITIPDDRRPVVDYSFTDDLEQPLDRNGQVTPGSLSINQVLAWWDPAARHYTAYTTRVQTSPITNVSATQAAADSGGTWTDHEIGHSTYKFKTELPAGYDVTKTHTLAVYASRNTDDIIGKNYYDNLEYDFRPDGQPVTDTWDKTTNAACNMCHDVLSAHGGSRQDVKLCVTCHQPQTVDPDTGNTVDMKVMVHKIHMGSSLPSVEAGTPYIIIGHNQSEHNFSDVVFPQDIRNCVRCHTPEATQSNVWYTYPSRAACASCHDDIDWVTGANHPAGAQADDSACASCHVPQGGREFDASVIGAHTVPYKSTQLKGLNAAIVSVSNAAPGQSATVTFRITENDGTPVPPSAFTTESGSSNLNILMGGPTADYAINPFRERADSASFDGTNATFTFTTPIPADATGTWAFSIEARRDVAVEFPPPGDDTIREAAFNPVHYENLGGGTADPRRLVVDIASCNTCHDRLAFHGGQRLNTQECVMCHNPNFTNDADPAESLDFKLMVHRLHTGEDLTQPYLDFNHLRFPGDRRDCTSCHTGDSQQVPENTPPGRLATQTPGDWYTPQLPTAAACLGCHDSESAAAHAFVNTAPFGEACATCHGVNASVSVDKAHAR
jgi:OmcA/MtrC family decaheme c-type cytochrome